MLKLKLTEKEILDYLDGKIKSCRGTRDSIDSDDNEKFSAKICLLFFQEIRITLFGRRLIT